MADPGACDLDEGQVHLGLVKVVVEGADGVHGSNAGVEESPEGDAVVTLLAFLADFDGDVAQVGPVSQVLRDLGLDLLGDVAVCQVWVAGKIGSAIELGTGEDP